MITINLSATGAKESVARLREFLAADGINLKQTHAYEALAQTLGYANWNTLQALLNAAPSVDDQRRQTATALANKLMTLPETVLNHVVGAMERSNAREGSRKAGLTSSLEQCLHRAIALATEGRHEFATLEHLLLCLTEDQDAASVFLACEIELDQLRNELTGYINSMLDDLNAGKGTAGKLLKSDELANQIHGTIARLDGILDKINAGQGTLGQLLVNPSLYESLDGTTREMHGLMKDFRANPKKFLHIKLGLF